MYPAFLFSSIAIRKASVCNILLFVATRIVLFLHHPLLLSVVFSQLPVSCVRTQAINLLYAGNWKIFASKKYCRRLKVTDIFVTKEWLQILINPKKKNIVQNVLVVLKHLQDFILPSVIPYMSTAVPAMENLYQ